MKETVYQERRDDVSLEIKLVKDSSGVAGYVIYRCAHLPNGSVTAPKLYGREGAKTLDEALRIGKKWLGWT